jgi:Schlafen group 3, DNA/RNA helicase domain
VLLGHVLFVIEFKVGESAFTNGALDQVWDYALDLRNFHETSHEIPIAPMLVATEAEPADLCTMGTIHDDGLLRPLRVGRGQLEQGIRACLTTLVGTPICVDSWEAGRYLPTPTIVEAARALYAGHSVNEISRSDAGAKNLLHTSQAIDAVITESRSAGLKSLCFVTGVPGAGKTLVGLDVAHRHMEPESELYSVFLSGNGPLVAVLREALSRDVVHHEKSAGKKVRKSEARDQVGSFIQNVHHFRDECLRDEARPPAEHVALFDEAQRAWNLEQTRGFMVRKKGFADFLQSEPEFLISCLNRHRDWAVIVCLVGGGQEINTGEAGISEWVDALCRKFRDWHVHMSPKLAGSEYRATELIERLQGFPNVSWNEDLHLATSMRSFRAEKLSDFVKFVLDLEVTAAQSTFQSISNRYPIVLTRSVPRAKRWLREQARGSERYGIVVSSQAQRLKPLAIDVRVAIDPVHWFLHDKDDTRSSYYLEDAATEFQIQGLELDWAAVVWDGDLRFNEFGWGHHEFSGSGWRNVRAPERKRYLENAYRVLLTRARQGMVIVVPEGDADDPTRAAKLYDPTFEYLRSVGLSVLEAD